jgi:hypothetical protein
MSDKGKNKVLIWILYRVPLAFVLISIITLRAVMAASPHNGILTTLDNIEAILETIGPILSAVLFTMAGIFYALGQLFPSYKRASLHTMSIDLIIGAIIVAALSLAANGFAIASSHLLANATSNSLV